MEKNKWHLFIMSLGLLFIASSPLLENPMINVIIGVLITGAGFILLKRK